MTERKRRGVTVAEPKIEPVETRYGEIKDEDRIQRWKVSINRTVFDGFISLPESVARKVQDDIWARRGTSKPIVFLMGDPPQPGDYDSVESLMKALDDELR